VAGERRIDLRECARPFAGLVESGPDGAASLRLLNTETTAPLLGLPANSAAQLFSITPAWELFRLDSLTNPTALTAYLWHTCAIAMRLMVDKYVNRSASLGSPGLDNIRWLAPVRAGDTITYQRVTTAARVSESKPDIGLVQSRWEARNQRGETVMTMEGWGMFRRRPANM